MKLIRITTNENIFYVEAEISWKIFGMKLYSQKKVFEKRNEEWYEVPGLHRVTSKTEKKKLENWISDHKKFILLSGNN